MNARKNPGPIQSDPRWERAMERLRLSQNACYGDCVGSRAGFHYHAPDPDDPATFLRVVEALLDKGVSIQLERSYVNLDVPVENTESDYKTFTGDNFHEAVMEAFGEG